MINHALFNDLKNEKLGVVSIIYPAYHIQIVQNLLNLACFDAYSSPEKKKAVEEDLASETSS